MFWKVIKRNSTIIRTFANNSNHVDQKLKKSYKTQFWKRAFVDRIMRLGIKEKIQETRTAMEKFGEVLVSKLGILLTSPEEEIVSQNTKAIDMYFLV